MALPVVLCIGSASVTGDALGPLVGDLLRERYNVPAYVYGGLARPVNGVNYERYVAHVKRVHRTSPIIAVDACVGDERDVGMIKIVNGGITAGGALKKNFKKVGDIGILGVVAKRSEDNLSELLATPYLFVEKMSERIARETVAILAKMYDCYNNISLTTQKNHITRCKYGGAVL